MVSAADTLWPLSRFSRPDFTRTLAESSISIIQVSTLQNEGIFTICEILMSGNETFVIICYWRLNHHTVTYCYVLLI
jgi:hypothetical protein